LKRQIRYWDSTCFLGWLKENEPDNREACKGVVEAAKRGNVLILTSALTLAEVVKLKHGREPIPKEHADKVKEFFDRHDVIEVRDVNRYIAEEARELVWDYGVDPKDAIHVATAIRYHITVLDTFDEPLIQLTGKLGNPPLRIGKPNVPILPTQEDLALEE